MRGELGLAIREPNRYLKYNRPERKSRFPTSFFRPALPPVFPLSVNDATSDPLLRPERRNPDSCPPTSISRSFQRCPQHAGDAIMSLPFGCFQPGVSAHPLSPGLLQSLIISLLFPPSRLQSLPLNSSRTNRMISLPFFKQSSTSHTEDKCRLPTRLRDPVVPSFQAISTLP